MTSIRSWHTGTLAVSDSSFSTKQNAALPHQLSSVSTMRTSSAGDAMAAAVALSLNGRNTSCR
jgi:hypothetical protein